MDTGFVPESRSAASSRKLAAAVSGPRSSLIALLLAGCSATAVVIPTLDVLVSDVTAGRELWNVSDIEDYRFEFRGSSAFCGSPDVVITVHSRRVSSITYANDGTDCYSRKPYKKGQNALPEFSSKNWSVDDLFDRLESCTGSCVVRSASFHPDYGFPVRFQIDTVLEDGTEIEDDFFIGTTLAFELL